MLQIKCLGVRARAERAHAHGPFHHFTGFVCVCVCARARARARGWAHQCDHVTGNARGYAAGAGAVLENAQTFGSLEEACRDLSHIFAVSSLLPVRTTDSQAQKQGAEAHNLLLMCF